MLEVALKLLKEFSNHSYKAYIVGGFVRDYILGIESNDIDITTNATPKEVKELFQDSCLPNEDYGSVVVMKKGIRFDITTFRRDIQYIHNRRPVEVQYINDLYPDILRRDFVMNTLCMDEDGKILDYLGGQEDIRNRIIHTVGDAKTKFHEDSLRMLRAIRFATILNFELAPDVVEAIREEKYLIKDLSYFRKKEEIDKIFNCPNRDYGIRLLLDLEVYKELELYDLSKVLGCNVDSSLAIWSLLNVEGKYPFQKNELDIMNQINQALELNNLDPMTLYRYGLYVNSCAGRIKGLDLKSINESYHNLVIKSRDDIAIDSNMIMELLGKGPGKYIKDIYIDIEREILYKRLANDRQAIKDYILKNYG